jgi:hypothetical protein
MANNIGFSNSVISTLDGTVQAVNGNGIVLAGRQGWLNVSKFAPDTVMPAAGTDVRLGLDRGNYIREITLLGVPSAFEQAAPSTSHYSEDDASMRLHCLKAAVDYFGPASGATFEELTSFAEQLVSWVTVPF